MFENKKPAKTAEELREENKKSLWEKLEDRRKKIFLQMNKDRPLSLLGAFLISCLLIIAFLCFIVEIYPPKDINEKVISGSCWIKMLIHLGNYSTIALAIGSLPIALTLWLFRNHDIVMNLDLAKYHEVVRNIHDEKASVGLRQVAVTTLLELKEKWTWGKKIRTTVFLGANLKSLDLRGVNLQGIDLRGAYLQGVNLRGVDLRNIDLQKVASLGRAKLQGTDLRGNKLEGVNLTEAKLQDAKLQGAKLQGAILEGAILNNAKLQNTDLHDALIRCTVYYKDKEAEKRNERTYVTKKWLEEQGALHVNTVRGISEE